MLASSPLQVASVTSKMSVSAAAAADAGAAATGGSGDGDSVEYYDADI